MKKIVLTFLIILIPLWLATYTIIGKTETDLHPQLKMALHEQLGTNKISKKIINSVEDLDLSNYNITDIKGLEEFINLKSLNLRDNMIIDGTPLANLESLESLNVRGNLIKSIEFVSPLQKLVHLNLRDNNIEDITPIKANTNLTYLNLRQNKAKDLEPLKPLENLVELNIRDNQIKSVEPLTHIPLTTRLNVSGNDVEDLHLLEDKLDTIGDIDFELDLPKPTLSVQSGFYDESFTLEIDTEEGHEIYYSLDGSTPNAQSHKYEGPIEISKELMYSVPLISNEKTSSEREGFSFNPIDVKSGISFKAVTSYKASRSVPRIFSQAISATYIFDDHLKTSSNLPIISLSIDSKDLFDEKYGIYTTGRWYEEDSLWSGNYAKRGREYERLAHFEMYNKDKQLDIDQDVGIRIHGRATRRLPQKSLRIYARDDYGQSTLNSNIFDELPYNRFKNIILRNSGNDNDSTLLRDGLMHELIKDLHVDVQGYQPAIILINGEYWGIQNIRERLNKYYVKEKYNVNTRDLALLKVFKDGDDIDFEIKEGQAKHKKEYFNILEFVENNDMSLDKNLSYIEENVDLENYLHYVAYQVYYANTDSFSNNVMIWKKDAPYNKNQPLGHDGRWRWMLFDLDWGMGYEIHETLNYEGDITEYNMINHVLADERRMSLFRNLMDNETVQEQFVSIMISLLDNEFESSHVKAKIDELSNQIRPEIERSINRWDNIESVDKWEENIQVLHDFAERRPGIIRKHLQDEFNLDELVN